MNPLIIATILALFVLASSAWSGECGDVNNDGSVNILDIVYLIDYKFKDGPEPNCGTETGTVTDIDGNIYQTIKIGDQWWMMENLKVTQYRNGDPIPNETDDEAWAGLGAGAYCEYDNDFGNVSTYGCLYNWYAVDDSRDIAPEGWHVPTDAEWQILVDYLGGDAVAGGKLKDTGTTHWNSPNTGANNESRFSALPGGSRNLDGVFHYMGNFGFFWTVTEADPSRGWDRYLRFDQTESHRDDANKRFGMSVRCIKD